MQQDDGSENTIPNPHATFSPGDCTRIRENYDTYIDRMIGKNDPPSKYSHFEVPDSIPEINIHRDPLTRRSIREEGGKREDRVVSPPPSRMRGQRKGEGLVIERQEEGETEIDNE
ncbi:hypothetical protein M8J75_002736 [Diaphorina citri]|nr:hypothetical protein M8J75_002736 [Diaphorina citri]